MIKTKTFSDEAEWLAFRINYIMASEISAILGLNKYKSANQYRKEKISSKQDAVINPVNSRRGKILEPAVIEALRHDLGWHIMPNGRRIYHDDTLMYGCTPDAFLLTGTEDECFGDYMNKAVIECKTTTTQSFERYWRGNKPLITQLVQTYVQMMLTEHETGYLAGMTIGEYEVEDSYNAVVDVKLAIYEIIRNKLLDDLIIEGIEKYNNHKTETRISILSSYSTKIESLLRSMTSLVGIYEGINNSDNPLTRG